MNKNQKQIGNKTEEEVGKIFQKAGYWCHIFEYNRNGQPCDIVALKGNKSFLVDVKRCECERFTFNRVEPNQSTCFGYAYNNCKIENTGFIIYFEIDKSFRWLPYTLYKSLKEKKIMSVLKNGLKRVEEII